MIPHPTRANARVAPTTFPHKYTERRAGSSRPTGGAEPSSSPQEPVPDRPAGSRLTFRDTAGGASLSPTILQEVPLIRAGASQTVLSTIGTGRPGVLPLRKKRSQTHRRGRTLAGPPYPGTAGGASPSPTGFKKIFSVWAGEALGAPARIRTGNVCSAKPGAVAEPHQRKFLQTQGPVAREEFRCPLRFCAPEILLHLSGTRPP